jgi:hypothetical protein
MVRCASMVSRVRANSGRAARSDHPERLLDAPQVVVAGDHLAGGHDVGFDVGDVALEPSQAAGARERTFIEGEVVVCCLDEPGLAGRLLALDHGAGTVLLRGEGLVVPDGSLGGVGPDRPPRA